MELSDRLVRNDEAFVGIQNHLCPSSQWNSMLFSISPTVLCLLVSMVSRERYWRLGRVNYKFSKASGFTEFQAPWKSEKVYFNIDFQQSICFRGSYFWWFSHERCIIIITLVILKEILPSINQVPRLSWGHTLIIPALRRPSWIDWARGQLKLCDQTLTKPNKNKLN